MAKIDNQLRLLLYRALTRKGGRLPLPAAFALYRAAAGLFSRRKVPSIRVIEREYLSYFREGLAPGGNVWTSIFVPTEILYAFGLSPFCLEGLAALCASVGIAGDFLGKYGTHFVPNTMCNFHRLAIDLGQSGLLPKPRLILASSALCDGNVKTFHHLSEELGVPFFFLDIPQNADPAGVTYLVSQLRELIAFIEEVTGRVFAMSRLNEAATHMRTCHDLLEEIYAKRCRLTRNLYHGHQMINFMLPLNAMSGSARLVRICRAILADLDREKLYNPAFPPEMSEGTLRIVWAHIAPAFQYNEAWPFIDDGKGAKIVMEESTRLPIEPAGGTGDNLELIARRLINTPGNGPLEKRLQVLETLCREAQADGIVHFSHWGCHQAAGAAPLMEQRFSERGIPFLNINGDGVDAQSCGLEQHKTRYSAFQESIRQGKSRAGGSP
jgi:benzoyl-CoA reductase/2-hydroxyglutaryl-CoA dehydratase subunit BcrC/BadD/HgdB